MPQDIVIATPQRIASHAEKGNLFYGDVQARLPPSHPTAQVKHCGKIFVLCGQLQLRMPDLLQGSTHDTHTR